MTIVYTYPRIHGLVVMYSANRHSALLSYIHSTTKAVYPSAHFASSHLSAVSRYYRHILSTTLFYYTYILSLLCGEKKGVGRGRLYASMVRVSLTSSGMLAMCCCFHDWLLPIWPALIFLAYFLFHLSFRGWMHLLSLLPITQPYTVPFFLFLHPHQIPFLR